MLFAPFSLSLFLFLLCDWEPATSRLERRGNAVRNRTEPQISINFFYKTGINSNVREILALGLNVPAAGAPDVCHRVINSEHKAEPSSSPNGKFAFNYSRTGCVRWSMERMVRVFCVRGGVFPPQPPSHGKIRRFPSSLTAAVRGRVRNKSTTSWRCVWTAGRRRC